MYPKRQKHQDDVTLFHGQIIKRGLLICPIGQKRCPESRVLWSILWRGHCLSVHMTEERALATILFAYLQGRGGDPTGVKFGPDLIRTLEPGTRLEGRVKTTKQV